MASILAMAGGAIINAFAFGGSNFLFSQISDHGAEERKRHDKAVEHLQKAHDDWYKQRQKRLDFINAQLKKEQHAEHTFNEISEAMQEYYLTTRKRLPPLPKEPKLSDFYHPSEQQKTGELIFISGGLSILGYMLYKYL